MVAWKRLPGVAERDHRLSGKQIRQRNVCRIPVVAVRQYEVRGPFKAGVRKNVLDQHAFPHGIELGPGRDTVNIPSHLGLRQGVELAPVPHFGGLRADLDGEFPIGSINERRGSG